MRNQSAGKRRVLVAEDEFLVFMGLEEDLRESGYEVLGPFTTVAEVCDAVALESIDGALLDINLGGEMIFPVADVLSARKLPFIFLSGYASATVPERFAAIPRLDKPYDPVRLVAALHHLFETAPPVTELPAA